MKLAIIGSRDYTNTQSVINYIKTLPRDTVIISGGARGVDSIAELTARECGLQVIIFKAEWEKFGKSAGYKRNQDIVDNCDELIAFWDGESRGTAHSIELARKQGKLKSVIS